ncbi:transposase [Sinorhizobium medicae]|nr:transposase [Sinorhizobium medicae]
MGSQFWLSDQQWSVIEPLLPKNRPGARRVDDRHVISALCMCCASAAVGRIARPSMARRPPFTIASIGGPAAACGRSCFRPLSRPVRATCRGSTARPRKPIARPPAERRRRQSRPSARPADLARPDGRCGRRHAVAAPLARPKRRGQRSSPAALAEITGLSQHAAPFLSASTAPCSYPCAWSLPPSALTTTDITRTGS